MRADLLLALRSISWMIAELVVDKISISDRTKSYQATHVSTLLPEPAMELGSVSTVTKIEDERNRGTTYAFLESTTGAQFFSTL